MKKKSIIKLLFFLCGFLVLQSCSKTSYTGLNSVDFKHLSSTRKVYSLTIDTRSKEDFKNGHLQHAINIPFSENFLTELEEYLVAKNAPTSLILFMYASSAYITKNQINEIKQNKNHQKTRKIHAVNYLIDDYTF